MSNSNDDPEKTDPDIPADDPRLDVSAEAASDDIDDSKYVSSLPGVLGLLDQGIAKVEAVMLAVGVLAMAANTIANAIGRFVFNSSIIFSEELNSVIIILITFAGISYAARHGRHIRMSAFFDALPFKSRKVMMIVIAVVTAAMMFFLAYYAFTYTLTQMDRGRVLPALSIPVWWTVIWAPLGFFLTGLQYALTAVKNIIDKDIWLSTSVLEGYDDPGEEV